MKTLIAALALLLLVVTAARAQDSVIVIDPDAPPADSLERWARRPRSWPS